MQQKMIVRAVAAIAGLGLIGGAGASGFQLLEQNGSGLGNAYAGSAVVGENASTVFYNPAAMTKLPGGNISGGVAFIKPSYRFKDEGSSNAPAAIGTNGADAGGLGVLPNLYATWQLSDNWFAGLGMGSPFGLKTEYDNDWVGRFQSELFDVKTYNVNPSIAFKASESVSLGLGVDYQRAEVVYKRQGATLYPGVPALNAVAQATVATFDATSEAYGWNVGATFKLSPTTDMGLSYRSKMFHHLEGTLATDSPLGSSTVFSAANITLPDMYIFSVSQRLDERWEMLGDVSRTNWSSIDKVAIDRISGAQAGTTAQTLDARFRDTWRFALGGTYKIDDNWKWKYGIAYDQTPVRSPEERLVSLPDNNRYWLTTGAQWKMDKTTAVDIGAAYLYIPETKINANQTASARGDVVGHYDGSILIFGAQLTKAF